MSSGKLVFAVRPGGCLVVEGAGFEAAVQDADEPVGEFAQGCVCSVPRARSASYRARAPGEALRAAKAWAMRASVSRSLRMNRAVTTFFLPDARVIGEVAA